MLEQSTTLSLEELADRKRTQLRNDLALFIHNPPFLYIEKLSCLHKLHEFIPYSRTYDIEYKLMGLKRLRPVEHYTKNGTK
jgi:hypothetical protein